MANQAGNQMVQYSATSSGAVTPGAAGDEVRVDCCLMATDGRSVVTGSSLGPPQVWDMQVRIQIRDWPPNRRPYIHLTVCPSVRLYVVVSNIGLYIFIFAEYVCIN